MVRLALCSIAVLAAVACIDVEVTGGEALPVIADMPDCTATGPACSTWTYLYACYFGPSSPHGGGCSAQTLCHATPESYGAGETNYVCGPSAHSCYQGVSGTNGMPGAAVLVHLVDGGAASDLSLQAALHIRNSTAPAGTLLNGNNMPLQSLDTQASAYLFTQPDLACINGWVKAGAPEN